MTTESTIDIRTSILTLEQLLKRSPFWSQRTLTDIYELANNCKFGLYFKLSNDDRCLKRKTYHSIKQNFKSLLNQQWLQDPANKSILDGYLKLQDKLIKFIKDHKFLLENKVGYARLATAIEVEISPFCEQGSVACFLEQSGIDGQEWNNYFGFVFLKPDYQRLKRSIISPAFHFHQRIISKDLIVFTDQVEAFEQKIFIQNQEKDILASKAYMSAHGKKMADKKHKNNRKVKEAILTEYKNTRETYESIVEAARILGKKHCRSPRTVEDYIHDLNKEVSIS